MYNYWTDEEIELLKTKYVLSNKQELLSMFPNHSWNAIKIKAGKYNLLKQTNWTEIEDEILKSMWGAATYDELLAALPGRTLDAIKNRGNDLEIKRPHSISYNRESWHNFFDNIDTSAKAYVLGFWIADGCIHYKDSQQIVIFSANDKEVLDIIRREINCPQNVCETHRKGQFTLRIHSKHMVDTLRSMGFDNNKSKTAELPEISENLRKDFVRGLCDGDGCIKRTKGEGKYHLSIDLNGTELLMKQVAEILPIETKPYKDRSIWRINVTRQKAKQLCEWMYKDSDNLRLSRKYDRYIESLNETGFYA